MQCGRAVEVLVDGKKRLDQETYLIIRKLDYCASLPQILDPENSMGIGRKNSGLPKR